MIKSFTVLAWKDAGGTFFPDGATRRISCNHINEGNMGLTMDGETFPLPTSTVPIGNVGTDFQHAVAAISPGTVFPSPTQFTDSGYKAVTRVKDMDTLQITYVDTADYATQFGICNDCCTPGTCDAVTPSVSGSPGATTATIVWTANSRAGGYEYRNVANSGTCVAPVVAGTFTAAATVSLTGLTTATEYCFAVRSICGSGTLSVWSFVQFTTA